MRIFSSAQTAKYLRSLERRVSSASVVLCDELGRVLVVKANYKKYWSLPGGIVDAGETPRQTAIRETAEEVGLQLSVDQLVFHMIVHRQSKRAHTYQFIFKYNVRASIFDTIQLDGKEIDAYEVVSPEQILANESKYSQTLVGWARGDSGYIEQQLAL